MLGGTFPPGSKLGGVATFVTADAGNGLAK